MKPLTKDKGANERWKDFIPEFMKNIDHDSFDAKDIKSACEWLKMKVGMNGTEYLIDKECVNILIEKAFQGVYDKVNK